MKKRGRPAALSRGEIVDAGIDLLREGGASSVTMTRVAELVGSSPMALYRHVESREQLLGSMLDHLLASLQIELPEDESWQGNIRTWMSRVRAHFLSNPEMLALIDFEPGRHISPTWLSVVGETIEPLRSAGLRGSHLAQGVLLVTRLTLGTLIQEIVAPVADTAAVVGGLGHLDKADSLRWIDVLPDLKHLDDTTFFALVQDQVIRELEQWAR